MILFVLGGALFYETKKNIPRSNQNQRIGETIKALGTTGDICALLGIDDFPSRRTTKHFIPVILAHRINILMQESGTVWNKRFVTGAKNTVIWL